MIDEPLPQLRAPCTCGPRVTLCPACEAYQRTVSTHAPRRAGLLAWSHGRRIRTHYTAAQADAVRRLLAEGYTRAQIAAETGIPAPSVSMVAGFEFREDLYDDVGPAGDALPDLSSG